MAGENLESKIALAMNHLAINIYKFIPKEQNAVLSPLSIATAFGMVYKGSRTTTAEELRNVLGYDRSDLPEEQVPEGFRKTLEKLITDPKNYDLVIANKALSTAEVPISESYKQALVEYFHAELEEVNFRKDGEAIMDGVNKWVNENTGGKIPRLLTEPPSEDALLVLLNAVYFKGTWKSKFEKRKSKTKSFYNSGTTSKDVVMMHMDVDTLYGESEELDAKFLELPYLGEDLSMLFILPNERNGLGQLEEKLTWEILEQAINEMFKVRDINVMLPKFKFEHKYDLKAIMEAVGVRKVFNEEADLGGISEAAPLYVSDAIHKAVVEVNEEGSEAAAVTAVMFQYYSTGSKPFRRQHYFHADHPFIFAIRERSTGLILFLGRVNDLYPDVSSKEKKHCAIW